MINPAPERYEYKWLDVNTCEIVRDDLVYTVKAQDMFFGIEWEVFRGAKQLGKSVITGYFAPNISNILDIAISEQLNN